MFTINDEEIEKIPGYNTIKQTVDDCITYEEQLCFLFKMESILESSGIYVDKGWIDGEIVFGPIKTKYWSLVKLMYAKDEAPNFDNIDRLLKKDIVVSIEEGNFTEPVKVKDSTDIVNQKTKKADAVITPVYVVTLKFPNSMLFDDDGNILDD